MVKTLKVTPLHSIFLILVFYLGLGSTQASKLGFEDAIFSELAVSGRALALGSAFISRLMIVRLLFITQLVWVLSGMLSFT